MVACGHGWSLSDSADAQLWFDRGLAQCLGRTEEAAKYRTDFEVACRRSDVTTDRSCYCKLSKD